MARSTASYGTLASAPKMGPGVLILIGVVLLLGLGYVIVAYGASPGLGAIAIPPLILGLRSVYLDPKKAIWSVLAFGFLLSFFSRYFPVFTFGLVVDIALAATFLLLFIKDYRKMRFERAGNIITLLMMLWMIYMLLELVNPEAHSAQAWFYSMRGIALYQVLLIPLGFMLLDSRKDFYTYLYIWIGLSWLGIFWGMKQQYFGLGPVEQAWLDNGQYKTHLLFGQLRIFSYYFDAATFGAAMAQLCIVCAIMMLGPFSKRKKFFFAATALFSFYGMMLSGTRGALSIPGVGALLFLILTKQTRILLFGVLFLLGSFYFLKYTSIGHSNYHVQRLRTALDPNDASLNTRFRNRALLTVYLKGKPFGGGVGTTSSFGRRFSPGTWLSNFEPDGLYTRIRAETGIVGRNFYVGMWLLILIRGSWRTLHMAPGENKTIAMALLAAFAGILMSNYGNPVMSQFPISLLTFLSLVFIEQSYTWDAEGKEVEPITLHPQKKVRSKLKRSMLVLKSKSE
ncbi:hypothetical protein GC167_08565 [bacterium]|nr:hypothetical protein [bacterium]